jgi:hypothetical protein
VLAVLVPVVFVLGMTMREPRPAGLMILLIASRLPQTPLVLNPDGETVELTMAAVPGEPDLLLYFTPNAVPGGSVPMGELPPGSLLLGPARDRLSFRLPARRGTLILFSLGHRRIVDLWPVELPR